MRSLASAVKKWLGGSLAVLLALGGMTGCQPTFLAKDVWDQAQASTTLMPATLEQNHCPPTGPIIPATKAPPTVNYPERPQREMTLQEAIAIALETGLVSGNVAEGTADTTLARFTPGTTSLTGQTDAIRVLAINPALAQANIESALARFDAIMVTSASMNGVDGIPGVPNLPYSTLGAIGQDANFGSSIVKAFANGAVANVSFLVNYRNITNTGGEPAAFFGPFNPQYSARLSFGYEMPLWRDSGVEINSLLSSNPPLGNQFTDQNTSIGWNDRQNRVARGSEGTLISRLRFDQTRAEFERNVQTLIKNVEIAYWNLYNKYGQLYSFEENLRILQRAYQENYVKFKTGAGAPFDIYQYYQTKAQFEEFRGNRIQALQEVLNAELQLRGIIGLPVEDGTRIVPITPPSLAEIKPNWENCLQDALSLRPELVLARENVRYWQYQLTIAKNGLKPDLRAFAKYEPFGDGPSLLGASPGVQATDPFNGVPIPTDNALRSLAGGHLTDFTLGVYLNVPLGFRFELAQIRAARLQLNQAYYFLRDQEEKAARYLADNYQETNHWYQRIGAHRSERLAYAEALRKYYDGIQAGQKGKTAGSLDFLSIQRSYAAALVKEYGAIAEYNNAMARLEWGKGNTLRYNNVHISEGPVPQCAQVRAVEYEKQRTRELKLCERPDSLAQPARLCAKKESDILAPTELPPVTVTQSSDSTSLPVLPAPAVAEGKPKLQTAPIVPGPLDPSWRPTYEKVDFKSAPAATPAPASLPSLPSDIKPIETPGTPLFLQETSSLLDAGAASFAQVRPDAAPQAAIPAAPITARGSFGDSLVPR